MALVEFTAEVREPRLLELPEEAEALRLKPGQKVQVRLVGTETPSGSNGKAPQSSAKRKCPGQPKELQAWGMLKGVLSVDDFLRRKREDTEREDMPIRERTRP